MKAFLTALLLASPILAQPQTNAQLTKAVNVLVRANLSLRFECVWTAGSAFAGGASGQLQESLLLPKPASKWFGIVRTIPVPQMTWGGTSTCCTDS
jgi:hypothetical protein